MPENKPLQLDPHAIESANNQSQFNAGNAIANDAQAAYNDGLEAFQHQPDWTDEQKSYADQRAAQWRDLVRKAYSEQLQRRAGFVPVNVAGPSNYPAAKMEKRINMLFKRANEWDEKMARFIANTKATLRSMTPLDKQLEYYRAGCWNDPISSDDLHALEKLRAKLTGLQEDQQRMKDINTYYRKHGTTKGCPGVTEAQAEKLDFGVDNKYSYQQQQPFQSWALQNNNGNMKRIKDRITQLEGKQQSADAGPNEPEIFDGFRIERHTEDNRVRIIFDSKPDESTRTLLKSNGFRWSPKAGAWQRQLNSNGLYACKHVIQALGAKQPHRS